MSLDRAAVIRQYKQLSVAMGLPCNQMVLGFGAAMVMFGLRKYTSDLDIDVPKQFFEQQKARKGSKPTQVGEVVAWDGLTDIRAITPEIEKGGAMEVHGVWVFHPVVLLQYKQCLAADPDRKPEKVVQDRKDIKALQEFLRNIPSVHADVEKAGLKLYDTKVS